MNPRTLYYTKFEQNDLVNPEIYAQEIPIK